MLVIVLWVGDIVVRKKNSNFLSIFCILYFIGEYNLEINNYVNEFYYNWDKL